MARRTVKVPPRVWYGADKLRAAYYAGNGKDAKEIAQIVGGTDDTKVRAMLSAHGLPLIRQTSNDDALMLKWRPKDRKALEAIAMRLERPADELAALILRKAMAEGPDFIAALVPDLDII